MFRLVVAMTATMAAVVFVMTNTHHVKMSFVFGSGVRVRLIFLLMITFLLGAIASRFFSMILNLRFRRLSKQLRSEGKATEVDPDLVVE